MRDGITMNSREDRKLISLNPTRATVNKSHTASDGCFQHDLYVTVTVHPLFCALSNCDLKDAL